MLAAYVAAYCAIYDDRIYEGEQRLVGERKRFSKALKQHSFVRSFLKTCCRAGGTQRYTQENVSEWIEKSKSSDSATMFCRICEERVAFDKFMVNFLLIR